MHNTPAAVSPKPFDFTLNGIFDCCLPDRHRRCAADPYAEPVPDNEVHARSGDGGFFLTGSAIIASWVSQFLAGRVRIKGDRKSLIVFAVCWGCSPVLFASNRNYFVLLFIGVFLSSFGSTANPADVRPCLVRAPDHTGREAVMFSSILRAQVSLAWVIGPLPAYALAMGFGFTVMYLSAAVAFVVCGTMVWFFCRRCVKSQKWRRGAGGTAA